MAFDGTLLNRPSAGRQRPISTALMLLYRGVFAPEPPARVSPNGDGVAETPDLRYRIVRPSAVNVTLRAPDGSTPLSAASEQPAGTYPVPFRDRRRGRRRRRDHAGRFGDVDVRGEGRRRPRPGVVHHANLRRRRHPRLPPRAGAQGGSARRPRDPGHVEAVTAGEGRRHRAWTRPAASSVAGSRRPAAREAGDQRVTWDGLGQDGKRLEGRFVVQVVATSALGRSELDAPIVIRKAAVPARVAFRGDAGRRPPHRHHNVGHQTRSGTTACTPSSD